MAIVSTKLRIKPIVNFTSTSHHVANREKDVLANLNSIEILQR